jgi:hypothetical protein
LAVKAVKGMLKGVRAVKKALAAMKKGCIFALPNKKGVV